LLVDRSVVRLALMRGTIHLVTARDAWDLRPLVQPVMDRVQQGQFGKRLVGVDTAEVVAMGRAFVDEQPRTFKQLGDHLLTRWPGRDRMALEQTVRTHVPLIQVPPRGLWGRSGPVAHTSIESWLGERPAGAPMTLDEMVLRYLRAFGPASVADMRTWSWLTGLRAVVDRVRPRLRTLRDERGRELLDDPDAAIADPDAEAPIRFLPEYDNLLLSHEDRSRMAGPWYPKVVYSRGAVLVDGFVAAGWYVTRARDTATLTVDLFTDPSSAERAAIETEASALLGFIAAEASERDVVLARWEGNVAQPRGAGAR
jgi:hypothetical protein